MCIQDLIYAKLALGNINISILVLTLHWCVLAQYTQYFPEFFWEKNLRQFTWGMIQTHDFSRAVFYKLDHLKRVNSYAFQQADINRS